MILKRLLFVGLVSLLTACSGGNSNGGGDTTTGGGGTTGSGTTGGGGTTGAGTTGGDAVGNQGVWTGDIGFGNGVFVVDSNNNFYGLSSTNGSTYNSSFGNIGGGSSYSGSLTDYFHPASGDFSGVAMAPIGESASNTALNLNIVTGQTIENSGGNAFTLVYNPGALTPASPSALAGSWVGTHSFPAPTDNGGVYAEYRMEITFSGNTFTGSTGVYGFGGDEEGSANFLHNVSGTVEGFSNVATTTFVWSDDGSSTTYNGVFYFDPNGSGNLLLNVQAANGAEPVTLNSVLVRR